MSPFASTEPWPHETGLPGDTSLRRARASKVNLFYAGGGSGFCFGQVTGAFASLRNDGHPSKQELSSFIGSV